VPNDVALKCPICGETTFEGSALPTKEDTIACTGCGHVFTMAELVRAAAQQRSKQKERPETD
jgi:uncharacterized Zn finger protein